MDSGVRSTMWAIRKLRPLLKYPTRERSSRGDHNTGTAEKHPLLGDILYPSLCSPSAPCTPTYVSYPTVTSPPSPEDHLTLSSVAGCAPYCPSGSTFCAHPGTMAGPSTPCAFSNSTVQTMWEHDSPTMKEGNNGTRVGGCSSVSVLFPVTMLITGMLGNSLAVLLVWRSYGKKENRRKRSFLLCIGSLALTDLTGQLLTSPVVIAVYMSGREWHRLDPRGHLCAFFGLSMTMFGLCPLFIASAMAIERTLAIRTPHWYASHMKTRATKTVLLAIWLGVFAFSLLPIIGVGQYTLQWPGTWCFISTGDTHIPGNTFFASTFASLGLIALTVTFSCNLATIQALVSRCRDKAATSQNCTHWGRITMETVLQLMGIMCVLFACWSPLLVIMLKMISTQMSAEHCKASYSNRSEELQKECNFFLTAVRLASLNQILDPWVYLLLRKILLQKFCQVANAVSNCSTDRQKEQAMMLATDVRQTEA